MRQEYNGYVIVFFDEMKCHIEDQGGNRIYKGWFYTGLGARTYIDKLMKSS